MAYIHMPISTPHPPRPPSFDRRLLSEPVHYIQADADIDMHIYIYIYICNVVYIYIYIICI